MPLYNSPQAYVFNLQTTSSAEAKRLWRSKIKEEWGYECAYCGSQDNLTIDHIVPKAVFLRTFTADIVLLAIDKDIICDENTTQHLQENGIPIPHEPVNDVVLTGDKVRAYMASGACIDVDVIYPAMGAYARNEILQPLMVKCSNEGFLHFDEHQQTNVRGLYVAGDIAKSLSQISVGMGQATIAATAMHHSLPVNPI